MIMPGGTLERISHSVYRVAGSPLPDHIELRAAWLKLAPNTPAWARRAEQGVVSHRSAASLHGLGDLPADRHEFTVRERKQSRSRDVRLHRAELRSDEWSRLAGLPVTMPARTAADLLSDHEEPDAVGRVIADALRVGLASPASFEAALSPQAGRYGFRRGNGLGVLRWLLELTHDPETPTWLKEASP
jgi:predicted transcriptional regulator of viral defense system